MQRNEYIHIGIETISVVFTIATYQAIDRFTALFSQENAIITIVSIICLGLAYITFNYIIKKLLDKWKWMKKAIYGSDYIEGYWLDTLYLDGKHLFVGLSYVSQKLGRFKISGYDYSIEDSNYFGKYESELALLDGSKFKYYFSYIHSDNDMSSFGYSELSFYGIDDIPTSYSGVSFLNIGADGKRLVFNGFRILDPSIVKEIKENPKNKRAIALRLFSEE